MTTWTPRRVEAWLIEAHDVLEQLPDIEQRYLRNPLRSRLPDCIETSATVFAAQVGAISIGGVSEIEAELPKPGAQAISRMETVMLGFGMPDERPWFDWLTEKQRRLVWKRARGMNWAAIAVMAHRSERTVQRWYMEALETMADELETIAKK